LNQTTTSDPGVKVHFKVGFSQNPSLGLTGLRGAPSELLRPLQYGICTRESGFVELLATFADIVLRLDQYLAVLVEQYGPWIYAILFAVIFSETGFVVTPFLPGDSLLFVAGGVAAVGGMDIVILLAVLVAAAASGNMLNYQIGRYIGPKVFQWQNSRFFNRNALLKTQLFYERHGGKTLVISRFLPLLRTFAPFVAGVGAMNYARFLFFNLLGALSWVLSLTLAGYFFANLPWVRKNLSLVIVGIILVSLIPVAAGWWHERGARKHR
jgi:membrane-associated protein